MARKNFEFEVFLAQNKEKILLHFLMNYGLGNNFQKKISIYREISGNLKKIPETGNFSRLQTLKTTTQHCTILHRNDTTIALNDYDTTTEYYTALTTITFDITEAPITTESNEQSNGVKICYGNGIWSTIQGMDQWVMSNSQTLKFATRWRCVITKTVRNRYNSKIQNDRVHCTASRRAKILSENTYIPTI